MPQSTAEQLVRSTLARADIQVDGDRSQDIRVQHAGFFRRILRQGSLGLGESYMDGWWEAQAVDEFIAHLLCADLRHRFGTTIAERLHQSWAYLWNLQNRLRARRAVAVHYDTGNELFSRMLDPLMNYSCGYWARAQNLAEAQRDKLDLICRKLQLTRGLRVLDIGCGWGGFAHYAANHYDVEVVGLTLSRAQATYARDLCADQRARIELCDYRDYHAEPFDRIVSIGMFEHVGARNYRNFLRIVRRLLKPDGILLLHTIGSLATSRGNDAWLNKYIFPNGELPSVAQLGRASEGVWVLEDWHNFGQDYDRTLMAWKNNFETAWPDLRAHYDERFYRMWRYYLMLCAGAFRARHMQLWQLVMTPPGCRAGIYRSVR